MANASHSHGPGCGHTAIKHDGHTDYLENGHLYHQEGNTLEDHVVAVSKTNPDGCRKFAGPIGHDTKHKHGPGCGHEAVPHGDHIDYLVDGRLHHPHGDHCDDHGPIEITKLAALHA